MNVYLKIRGNIRVFFNKNISKLSIYLKTKGDASVI